MPARDAIKPLREALEDVARREVAFAAKDAGVHDAAVAERTASRIVAKLLAGPMAALRRAVQRGEPLDAQAMMLLEMFSPAAAPAPRPSRTARTPAPAVRVAAAVPPVPAVSDAPHAPASGAARADGRRRAPREVRSSLILSPEQFT
jgi:hypothetical protein